jgi:putative IMPACT (imprinted ancient) family translation regulator
LLTVHSDHQDAGRIENALRASSYKLADVQYGSEVKYIVHLNEEEIEPFRAWLGELTGGRNHAEITGQAFIEVPIA